jgi:hypothetical protein
MRAKKINKYVTLEFKLKQLNIEDSVLLKKLKACLEDNPHIRFCRCKKERFYLNCELLEKLIISFLKIHKPNNFYFFIDALPELNSKEKIPFSLTSVREFFIDNKLKFKHLKKVTKAVYGSNLRRNEYIINGTKISYYYKDEALKNFILTELNKY